MHRDTEKQPKIVREVGQWLYHAKTMEAFRVWCRAQDVRAYGSFKMTTMPHFARCLRATRLIRPGEAIITCPHTSIFNFLTVAREQYEEATASSGFPLPLSWANYRDRLDFLKSTSVAELAMAAWMVRIASLENSVFTPYIHYLLEDTRGRDGVAQGLSKEREDNSGVVDHFFSELATDAGEDPEVFLENLFRSFACLHLRTQPIETEAIRPLIPGTNFFKAKAAEMFVPTLLPMIDAVPQVEDGTHNTVLQYYPLGTLGGDSLVKALLDIAEELRIPMSTNPSEMLNENGEKVYPLFDISKLRGGGLFALRAIRAIEEGDVLYLRHYPADGDAATHGMNANVMEANRILSHEN